MEAFYSAIWHVVVAIGFAIGLPFLVLGEATIQAFTSVGKSLIKMAEGGWTFSILVISTISYFTALMTWASFHKALIWKLIS